MIKKKITEVKDVTVLGKIDPDSIGIEVQELIEDTYREWIHRVRVLGKKVKQVKDFYGKNKEFFNQWLDKYVKIRYAHAMQWIRISEFSDDLVEEIVAAGFTSTHVNKLLPLKEPAIIKNFLEEESHPIDFDGTEVKTTDMKPDDIAKAIKIMKGVDEEDDKLDTYIKAVGKIDNMLDKISGIIQDEISVSDINRNDLPPMIKQVFVAINEVSVAFIKSSVEIELEKFGD